MTKVKYINPKTHTTYSLYREYGTPRYHVAIFREAPLPENINVLFYNGPYELDKALEIIKNRKRPPKDDYSNKQERYDAWINDNRVRVVAEECVSQEGTVVVQSERRARNLSVFSIKSLTL